VRFWDASAIVPLIIDEPGRERLLGILEADPVMIVWWGTSVELVSALSRRERDGTLPTASVAAAVERVRKLERAWHQVAPTTPCASGRSDCCEFTRCVRQTACSSPRRSSSQAMIQPPSASSPWTSACWIQPSVKGCASSRLEHFGRARSDAHWSYGYE
jgi:hypothetical protein